MANKVIFRADAGQNIGYGHFIRSLALADMLKDDFDVAFAVVNPTDYQRDELANICACIRLNQETHFEDFLSMLKGDEIAVLDNYFFTTDYQRAIKEKGCKLVCIDDMHDKHYVADIVINHGIDNPALFSVEPHTRLCLGIEWALLRKPFIEVFVKTKNKRYNSKIENIVVSFGGVDSYHLTDKIIHMLQAQNNVKKIDAIVGEKYQEQIEERELDKVSFHRAISAQKVADLFSNCDLAVLSASTTCIEALACNTKVAAGYYINNQKELYKYLLNHQFIYGLGNLLNERQISCQSMESQTMVSSNKFTFEKVIEMYVDLFNSLKKSNIKNPLKLKFINYIHVSNILSKKIHEIRNSDSIRFFMDDADIFSFEDHLIFIDKLKRCIDKKYWAVCKGDDYIGSIYLNPIYLDDKIAEWGIFINPHFSNNGYGTEMGELFFQFMKQSFSLNRILSKVKKNNTNSLCFHQKLGFEITKITKDYYQLEKTLIVE